MIEEKQLTELSNTLKRIFTMPISKSTFREIQNAILALSPGNQEDANSLFEVLVTGEIKPDTKISSAPKTLEKLIDEYSISTRVAKDVFERGEFISIVSSDIISQPNRVAFLNRIRRVDGQEFHFLADTKGTINLLHHLIGRLQELENNEAGKETINGCQEELKSLRVNLNKLIAS
ncbi:MAG: hypothetical protein K940chlam7_00535 [Chlamydiae bacterium]|nr:hypothetical protein [Chlamydiota bacterium]